MECVVIPIDLRKEKKVPMDFFIFCARFFFPSNIIQFCFPHTHNKRVYYYITLAGEEFARRPLMRFVQKRAGNLGQSNFTNQLFANFVVISTLTATTLLYKVGLYIPYPLPVTTTTSHHVNPIKIHDN